MYPIMSLIIERYHYFRTPHGKTQIWNPVRIHAIALWCFKTSVDPGVIPSVRPSFHDVAIPSTRRIGFALPPVFRGFCGPFRMWKNVLWVVGIGSVCCLEFERIIFEVLWCCFLTEYSVLTLELIQSKVWKWGRADQTLVFIPSHALPCRMHWLQFLSFTAARSRLPRSKLLLCLRNVSIRCRQRSLGAPSLLVDLVRRFHHQKCFIICWPICHHVDWSKKKMAHGCEADWHATRGSSACTTLCGPAETQPSMVSSKVACRKMSSTCYEHLRRVSHLLI
jgi:hypothetical protein